MSTMAPRHRDALHDLEDDLTRAIDDLYAAINDVVGVDGDATGSILIEEEGATRVDMTELDDLLSRLADAPEAAMDAFENFGWEIRRALQALRQALVAETAGG
jgi:hypothetical protein